MHSASSNSTFSLLICGRASSPNIAKRMLSTNLLALISGMNSESCGGRMPTNQFAALGAKWAEGRFRPPAHRLGAAPAADCAAVAVLHHRSTDGRNAGVSPASARGSRIMGCSGCSRLVGCRILPPLLFIVLKRTTTHAR